MVIRDNIGIVWRLFKDHMKVNGVNRDEMYVCAYTRRFEGGIASKTSLIYLRTSTPRYVFHPKSSPSSLPDALNPKS